MSQCFINTIPKGFVFFNQINQTRRLQLTKTTTTQDTLTLRINVIIIQPASHICHNNRNTVVPVNLPESWVLSPSFISTQIVMGYILEKYESHTSTEFLQEPGCYCCSCVGRSSEEKRTGKVRQRRCPGRRPLIIKNNNRLKFSLASSRAISPLLIIPGGKWRVNKNNPCRRIHTNIVTVFRTRSGWKTDISNVSTVCGFRAHLTTASLITHKKSPCIASNQKYQQAYHII